MSFQAWLCVCNEHEFGDGERVSAKHITMPIKTKLLMLKPTTEASGASNHLNFIS